MSYMNTGIPLFRGHSFLVNEAGPKTMVTGETDLYKEEFGFSDEVLAFVSFKKPAEDVKFCPSSRSRRSLRGSESHG